MAKRKSNGHSHKSRKSLSEGKTIMLTVVLFVAGLIATIYLIKLVLAFFFPGWIN